MKTTLPPDATKLLLDRIISWEKNLSEYASLESILRSKFLILQRKATNGYNEMERLHSENAKLQADKVELVEILTILKRGGRLAQIGYIQSEGHFFNMDERIVKAISKHSPE